MARDKKTGAPLECLHVALVDATGSAVAQTVTDSSGQFLIEAPAPGAYRVRFQILGWEPVAGPLDTLAAGDLKARAYPVDFATMHVPSDRTPLGWQRYDKVERSSDSEGVWTSARLVPGVGLRYPDVRRYRGDEGIVLGQFIVDANGMARLDSWRTIDSTHVDFVNAVRAALPNRTWTPAQLGGRPSCELVRELTNFKMPDANKDPVYRHD